jgi:hypothetical protein
MFKTLDELTRGGESTTQIFVRSVTRWILGSAMTTLWIPVFMYLLPAE